MNALSEFEFEPRWIVWKNEPRNGKITKIPYCPHAPYEAKADDPRTWNTRSAAESRARNIVNGRGGGIGIELGDLGNGLSLGGVDLDTCYNENGEMEAWAVSVIERLASYTEISPSETGAKIFFKYKTGDLDRIRKMMGESKFGKQFKLSGAGKDHPPAIEVYLGNRYFATTEWHIKNTPNEIRLVDTDDIIWLLSKHGPEFAGGSAPILDNNINSSNVVSLDQSRSGIAYRLGKDLRRNGATFEQMCDGLRTNAKTSEWYREKGDRRQLQRIWDKAERVSARNLPIVQLGGGKLPANIDDAESYMIENDHEVFQRGDMVIRPAKEVIAISDHRQSLGMRMVPIKTAHLADRLTRIIDFKRFDSRSSDWVSVNCPTELATAYLERVGEWRLPILSGIIDVPTLRPDGSILDTPGYDNATGVLYAPSGEKPRIPFSPNWSEARAALDSICDLISGFPFVDLNGNECTNQPSSSRSVALSIILTAITRRSLANAPLHAFTAPVMGSGKSKLVDIASMIATGNEAPVISQGKTEEETEKRLGAALIAGDPIISWDNCEYPLGGELMCQALTQRTLKIRPLGKSMLISLPTNATFAATGNNLIVSGDMTRRTIVSTLDPKMERPEQRVFDLDPVAFLRDNRIQYVINALTVLRAFVVAKMPRQDNKPLGSFEDWSRKIRDCLIWLGETDPCETMDRARIEDPQTQALTEVLVQWNATVKQSGVSVKRVIEIASLDDNADLRDALLAVAGDRDVINNRRLGKWLSRNKGRIINGLRIDPDTTGAEGTVMRWKVTQG